MERIILAIGGFLAGAALGSFASATALAWLERRPVFVKRSVCARCGRVLRPVQLVPVFSYLALGGKCGFCGGKIPPFHFFVELLSALLGACFLMAYGPGWLAFCYMIMTSALVSACALDIKAHLLPDYITLGLLAFLLPLIVLDARLTIIDAAAGYVLGGGIPLCLHIIFKAVRKKDCLGFGDIKLFALSGALAGWQALPFIFFSSSLCGVLAFLLIHFSGNKSDLWTRELPFGPFICAALFIVLLMPRLPWLAYAALLSHA